MTKQMTIKEMNKKTIDSYSYDTYSYEAWNEAIQSLRAKNLNDQEVEAFLLSKHMRWARDCGQTIKEYIEKSSRYINPKYLTDLINGTVYKTIEY